MPAHTSKGWTTSIGSNATVQWLAPEAFWSLGSARKRRSSCVRDRSPKGRDALKRGAVAERDESPARFSARRSASAWRDNMLAFDGETLNEAIVQVSQQTGWTFELADPELGEMRVGGYMAADPEAFIQLLSSSLNLEARRGGDRRVILTRRS